MSWNKNSAKVIGITAAAAMALSLAPATALTAYAAPRNGSSVSEQAAGPREAFENGSLTAATVDGKPASVKNNTVSFEFNGKKQIFTPTVITLGDGTTLGLKIGSSDTDLIGTDGEHYTLHKAEFQDQTNQVDTLTRSDGAVLTLHVSVTATDLKGVVADSASNLTYNAQPQQITYSKNGVKLVEGTDYDVFYYKDAGHNQPVAASDIKDAGTYYAELRGKGNYGKREPGHAEAPVSEVTITVKPLDLSKAIVIDSDVKNSASTDVKDLPSKIDINGVNGSALIRYTTNAAGQPVPADGNDAQLEWAAGPNNNHSFMNAGAYTYIISPVKNNTNVVNSAQLHFNRVEHVFDHRNFQYNGTAWGGTHNINLDRANPDKFDLKKIVVNTNVADPTTLSSDKYNVVIEKKSGNNWVASSVEDLNSVPGDYRIRVIVDPSKTNYVFGGNSGYMYINTGYNLAHVYVKVNEKQLGHNSDSQLAWDTYNGKAFPVDVRVVSNNLKKVLKQGVDYTVEIQKAPFTSTVDDWADTDTILNAGQYKIIIKTAYSNLAFDETGSGSSMPTVDTTYYWVRPRQVSAVRFSNAVSYIPGGQHFAYRNGSKIVPVPIFKDSDPSIAAADRKVWNVPSTDYVLSYSKDGKPVDSISGLGKYNVYINDASQDDNFAVDNDPNPVPVTVTNARYFEDVPADSYYNQFIYDMAEKGIMKGYGNSSDFGFYAPVKRGEFVTALYRLALYRAHHNAASGTSDADQSALQFSNDKNTVKMPYKDVVSNTYYSVPIAWATKIGVATGDPKTNLFRPNDTMSAQELVSFLARYAKLVDPDFKAADDNVLNGYVDAKDVAQYAKSHVAWAVANKILGQGTNKLNPTENIQRWRVATILSRSELATKHLPVQNRE